MSSIPVSIEPQLVMRNSDLASLPKLELPEGFTVCSYEEGLDLAWERIISKSFSSDSYLNSFDRIMKSDPAYKPERVIFLKYNDQAVATASAWYKPQYSQGTGNIHFVGVLPGFRGKRLGYLVSLAAMLQLAHEDCKSITLETDDFRMSAIITYLRLGFRPVLIHENQRDRWSKVFAELENAEDLLQNYEEILAGPVELL